MRAGDKDTFVQKAENQILSVDFRDGIQGEETHFSTECAAETGYSSADVKMLKKRLRRS